VSELPERLEANRHRDLIKRGRTPGWRRLGMLGMGLAVVLALFNRFGQEPSTSRAAGPAATLAVRAPEAVRGGLLWQARIEVVARNAIEHPRLVLDQGWLEGMQVNTLKPEAVSEASRQGRLVLSYDRLDAGDRLVVWLQFQSDPTHAGTRDQAVELDDAANPLVRVERTMRVLP
jgi:hypothetical protein